MRDHEIDWSPPPGREIALLSGTCFYREAGEGAPTIVLLHGLPTDSRVYARLQPLLARRFSTLAPDFFGWGASKPNDGLPFGFDMLDRNLEQFVTAHGLDRVVLVAQDMSGPPAIRWAAAHPDRIGALVLLNTYYGWNSARMPPILKLLHAPVLGRLLRRLIGVGQPGLSWRLFRWQTGRVWARRGPDTERILRTFHGVFRHATDARAAFHAINDQLVGHVNANQRRLDIVTGLDCPTLILWGGKDPYLRPSVARQFHRLIPNSQVRMVADAGHFLQLESPDEVAQAIAGFVQGLPELRGDA